MSSSLNKTPIFREYIGVKAFPKLDEFPDIVSNVKEFHFILGIGTENYTTDGKGTGHFNCTWNVQYFNKERVREIKEKYKAITDVKVILSFGGLGDQNPFNPSEKNLWINKAYASIKAIVQSYQIKVPCTNPIINTIDGIRKVSCHNPFINPMPPTNPIINPMPPIINPMPPTNPIINPMPPTNPIINPMPPTNNPMPPTNPIINPMPPTNNPMPPTNPIINPIDDIDKESCINTIDGIDINYEYIIPDDRFVFTSCIGVLITKLKNDPDLSLNTFSISPSELVQIHYSSLYLNYPNAISWINYQFYLHRVSSKDKFVTLYQDLVQKYPANKFLPGVSTDPDTARNMKREHFIDGIIQLNNAKPLAGAFVWNANDSKDPRNPSENPYFLEKTIQDILNTGAI